MLTGKGMWLWEIENTEADGDQMVALARDAGLGHIIVKLTDGEYSFPLPAKDPDGSKERLTHDVIARFQEAGIAVWGWGFAYGSGVDIEKQAYRMAARIRQFGLKGVVVNAEDFGQRKWSSQGGDSRARRYMEALHDGLAAIPDDVVVALSSYRYLSAHTDFPFAAFLNYCDVAMPQVYWVTRGTGDALATLQKSYEEYAAAFPSKFYLPTGAAYGEYYGTGSGRFYWSATPEQITRFLLHAQTLGLPAVNFWGWQHARNDTENLWFSGTQLWQAISTYPYDAGPSDGRSQPDQDAAPVADVVEVHVGDGRYHDGVYAGMPNASFAESMRLGRRMKFARTSISRSGVWAAWVPSIPQSGKYEIDVWVPGINATTEQARYYIHGVEGQAGAVHVLLNQQQYYDTWVSLGAYQLNTDHPQSGMVNLNNLTGEPDREIAFSGIRWRAVDHPADSEPVDRGESGDYLSDGFDPPVGTRDERRAVKLWPGLWFDATGFGTHYRDSGGNSAYHTGADLNLNKPHWNVDAGMPVCAMANGVVTFAGSRRIWNGIVVIRHDPFEPGGPYVFSRSAHLETIAVRDGQRVKRGDVIGTIGKPTGGTEHLHFDISPTETLLTNPGDWPLLDYNRLRRDYIDPKLFIQQNRPR